MKLPIKYLPYFRSKMRWLRDKLREHKLSEYYEISWEANYIMPHLNEVTISADEVKDVDVDFLEISPKIRFAVNTTATVDAYLQDDGTEPYWVFTCTKVNSTMPPGSIYQTSKTCFYDNHFDEMVKYLTE